MGSVIYDGLTQKAFIAEVPRLHGELRFKFRPPTTETINRFIDGLKKQSLVALCKAETEAMAAKVVEWSLLDMDGQPLPIKNATVAHLQPSLFNRLKDIVLYGREGGDADPAEEIKELQDDTADAAEQGLNIAQLREDRDAKN